MADGNQYAIKAFRVGRSTPLGLAYTAATVALERLRKISHMSGAAKAAKAAAIHALVREHESKTMAEAEMSAAANVATSRHSKVLEQIRAEEKRGS